MTTCMNILKSFHTVFVQETTSQLFTPEWLKKTIQPVQKYI